MIVWLRPGPEFADEVDVRVQQVLELLHFNLQLPLTPNVNGVVHSVGVMLHAAHVLVVWVQGGGSIGLRLPGLPMREPVVKDESVASLCGWAIIIHVGEHVVYAIMVGSHAWNKTAVYRLPRNRPAHKYTDSKKRWFGSPILMCLTC